MSITWKTTRREVYMTTLFSVVFITGFVFGMLVNQQLLIPFPPAPPADHVHRIVQETCITCHHDRGVLK